MNNMIIKCPYCKQLTPANMLECKHCNMRITREQARQGITPATPSRERDDDTAFLLGAIIGASLTSSLRDDTPSYSSPSDDSFTGGGGDFSGGGASGSFD